MLRKSPSYLYVQEFDLENMSYNKSFRYAMKNCLYEAVLEKIIENCTCKPTFVNFVLTVSGGF